MRIAGVRIFAGYLAQMRRRACSFAKRVSRSETFQVDERALRAVAMYTKRLRVHRLLIKRRDHPKRSVHLPFQVVVKSYGTASSGESRSLYGQKI